MSVLNSGTLVEVIKRNGATTTEIDTLETVISMCEPDIGVINYYISKYIVDDILKGYEIKHDELKEELKKIDQKMKDLRSDAVDSIRKDFLGF